MQWSYVGVELRPKHQIEDVIITDLPLLNGDICTQRVKAQSHIDVPSLRVSGLYRFKTIQMESHKLVPTATYQNCHIVFAFHGRVICISNTNGTHIICEWLHMSSCCLHMNAYSCMVSAYECIQLHVVCIWMHTAACEMHVSCVWAACGMHIRCVSVAYNCICKIRKWHAESFVYVQNIWRATACTSVSTSFHCLWAAIKLHVSCL